MMSKHASLNFMLTSRGRIELYVHTIDACARKVFKIRGVSMTFLERMRTADSNLEAH